MQGFRRAEILVYPLLFTLLAAAGTNLTDFAHGFGVDGRMYAAIAYPGLYPEAFRLQAPWCWRLLSPMLVSLLPLPPLRAFLAANLAASYAAAVLLLFIGARMKFNRRTMLLLPALYTTIFWTVRWGAYTPPYIDSHTQVFMLAAILAALHGRLWMVCALLFLGVLQKESVLFVAPVAAVIVWSSTREVKRSYLWLFLFLLCGLAAYALPRIFITPVNEYSPEAALRVTFARKMTSLRFWESLPASLFSGLGFSLVLTLFEWRRAVEFFRKEPWIGAMIALGIVQLFAGWDTARICLAFLPAMVLSGAFLCGRIIERRSRSEALLVIGLAFGIQAGYSLFLSSVPGYQAFMTLFCPDTALGSLRFTYRHLAPWLSGAVALALYLSVSPSAAADQKGERG